MKLITYVFVVLCSIIFMASPKMNPLSDTTWNGILNAPDPMNGSLKFSEDTLYVYIETQLIETSTYTINKDTLKIVQLSGSSPCEDELGVYVFKISDDMLDIKPISDFCEVRYEVFSPLGYKKK